MRLTVVGCAGSFAGPDSAASCYLVVAPFEGRTYRLLIDLGSGAFGPLQRHTTLRAIDAVGLSHLHPDHCLDLCGLYVALRYDPAGPATARLRPAARAGREPVQAGRAAREPGAGRPARRARMSARPAQGPQPPACRSRPPLREERRARMPAPPVRGARLSAWQPEPL